jgi:GNAT superfamily N-acetyltransferase
VTPSSEFVELNKAVHDRSAFDCGTPQLNEFLQQFAAKHRAAGISMTMVLPAKGNEADICAYYTLSHTEISRKTLPKSAAKSLPHYPVPVLLIAQLAVNRAAQGQGLGKITLIRALRHAHAINEHLPSYAVVVDALDDGVRGFYEQFGFHALDTHNDRTRLYLSMQTVLQLFAE